jgi:carbohydrate-binding DOMON domain-containing protein
MATAEISSQFDITIQGADLNVAKTFTASRSFRIVSITVFNAAAATATLTVTNSTTGVVLTSTTAAPPIQGPAFIANQTTSGCSTSAAVIDAAVVLQGQTVSVETSAVTVSRVSLHCVGNPSESITIS